MRGRDIRFDFSVNVNPLGMPEAARTALLSDWKIYEEYPDDGYKELREALAARFDVKKAQIVCGNESVRSDLPLVSLRRIPEGSAAGAFFYGIPAGTGDGRL